MNNSQNGVDGVVAGGVVVARYRGTLVNINVTDDSSEAR